MDKKTGGIIAFVATIVCCGLPGCFSLCMGLMFAVAGGIPGANIDIGGSNDPKAAIGTGIAMICASIILIAIPVVVGFFTMRNKPASANISEPLPPAS